MSACRGTADGAVEVRLVGAAAGVMGGGHARAEERSGDGRGWEARTEQENEKKREKEESGVVWRRRWGSASLSKGLEVCQRGHEKIGLGCGTEKAERGVWSVDYGGSGDSGGKKREAE